MTAWSPASWRGFEARQQPDYPDRSALAAVVRELEAYPALTAPASARALQGDIAAAQDGNAFLLQGGDCAESFAEFSPATIAANARLIDRMSAIIAEASGLPVIRVARLAGQFAKPRSADIEHKSGDALPVYRGDIVNGIAFEAGARTPDPERMIRAYAQSSATLAHLAALGGNRTPIRTSHEALLLPYEQALVRVDPADGLAYGSSAPLLWLGKRTRFGGSAHVEFLRGLANPIAIKCDPALEPDALLRLLDLVDPHRTRGRITLISRMGHDRVERTLPPLLHAVQRSGHPVLWSCDPMHGNTIRAASGVKTRPLDRILAEAAAFFALTRAERVAGLGIHLEMTGQNVTECTGGAPDVTEADLANRYRTHCDPRLNPAQAIELARLIAANLCVDPPVRRAGGLA